MNIKDVGNAVKVGDFFLRSDTNANKIGIKYVIDNNKLKDDQGRVYLIVINGIIKKIGGSQSKGGMKTTMDFYLNSMTGSPGPSRFIIHLLIEKELLNGKNVEVYMIKSPKVLAPIYGLNKVDNLEVAAFKEMEDLCKAEYFEIENKYPDWNFQENNIDYPSDLYTEFNKYHKNRVDNKK